MTLTIDSSAFTPYSALLGGALIGLASALLILGIGRIAGISGIASHATNKSTLSNLSKLSKLNHSWMKNMPWQLTFILGMIMSAWLVLLFMPFPRINISNNLVVISIAGLLVGFGTRLGSGCTSGHGVCGLSRLSLRSLAATLCFMMSGFITVFILQHLFD